MEFTPVNGYLHVKKIPKRKTNSLVSVPGEYESSNVLVEGVEIVELVNDQLKMDKGYIDICDLAVEPGDLLAVDSCRIEEITYEDEKFYVVREISVMGILSK